MPDVPSSDQEQGVLPRLIATLVGRRREVKKLMKDKRATPEQLALWDTKQLAFKLTANSMYGCLGYTQSRFYARPLAMLTTFKGREILRNTKELAESQQLRVIYGDTDSVMINTNMENMSDALKVGEEFKKAVNERYRLLEIDVDNVFRRLLLHAKKKYAAVNLTEVDGKYVEKLEVKGLDMKRREYCALSKEVSSKLLNEILSGEDPEVVLNKVHEYLRELAERMKEYTIPVQKYVIYTVSNPIASRIACANLPETLKTTSGIPQQRKHASRSSRLAGHRQRQKYSTKRCHLIYCDQWRLGNCISGPRKTILQPTRCDEARLGIETRCRVLHPQADLSSH